MIGRCPSCGQILQTLGICSCGHSEPAHNLNEQNERTGCSCFDRSDGREVPVPPLRTSGGRVMTCGLCRGTGFVQRDIDVAPLGTNGRVAWVANLVACSHPEAPADGPSVTEETGAVAASGGSGLVQGMAGGVDPSGTPASLDGQRQAHDERVDGAAYERVTGGAP